MGLLNRNALLSKEKYKIEKVDIDEETYVYVREMSGRERENFERSITIIKKEDDKVTFEQDLDDFRAKMVVCTVCDEDGCLILLKDDYAKLSEMMTAKTLAKIADAAQKLNQISEPEKAKLVKNSEADLAGNSNSDSV